ncbi:MAG: hypothetical protein I8H71_15025 [Xanthomonadaceae bacterium]|nr:hypothetical protein [Xanthomonadaceae bacterium]
MSNLYSHPGWWHKDGTLPPPPPTDMDLSQRVAKLESIAEKTSVQLTALEKDVAVIKSNYATKADVAEAKNSVIMWVVSAILLAQLLPTLLKKFGL